MRKLTATQIEALKRISNGTWHSFGYGCGKFRVALRALKFSTGDFVNHRPSRFPHHEQFQITEAGRQFLAQL